MWPRSHTSGLMIGECTRSSCSSSSSATSASVRSRAARQRLQHLRGVGGEGGGRYRAGCHGSPRCCALERPCWVTLERMSLGAGGPLQVFIGLPGLRRLYSWRSGRLSYCADVVPAGEDRLVWRSWPSTQMAPVESPSRAPFSGTSAIQRAPSTRSMCPWEKTATPPSQRGELRDHAVGARADLARRSRRRDSRRATDSSPGAAARICGGRQALVVAVVPLEQVRRARCAPASEPAQLAGFARAHQRADEHELEAPAREPLAQAAGDVAAVLGERDVACARCGAR